jgi:hypothetical protein
MVMLTLARFITETFGGDTMDDVRAALERHRARLARPMAAPVAGRLSEAAEAGSGGDD